MRKSNWFSSMVSRINPHPLAIKRQLTSDRHRCLGRCIAELVAINMGPGMAGSRVSVSDSEAAIARMVRSMLLNKVCSSL